MGLVNQGATCYLNSTLQTIFMTPEFRMAVYKWKFLQPEDEFGTTEDESCALQVLTRGVDRQMCMCICIYICASNCCICGVCSCKGCSHDCRSAFKAPSKQHHLPSIRAHLLRVLESNIVCLAYHRLSLYALVSYSCSQRSLPFKAPCFILYALCLGSCR